MKRSTLCLTALLVVTTAVSCGGGGDAAPLTPGPSPSFVASFTPGQPTPGNNSVTLSQQPGGGGNLVTVNVGVTGVNDVFGASFRITYDPALVDFAHRVGVDAGFANDLALSCIDIPNTDQGHVFGGDLGAEAEDIFQILVTFAQDMRQRHAVDVAAG